MGGAARSNGQQSDNNQPKSDADSGIVVVDPASPGNDALAGEHNLFTPPDGDYGWVIVLASFMCNLIVDGVCYSFGVFFLEFLDYFGESAAKTAWVGSLLPGMYLTMGPVVGALANKYGCRIVTISGSILSLVSFIVATFSPNVDILILTYGVMGGIGFGLMYLPSVVLVGFYFEQKRALATGIAVCGSGIGTFIFAPLSQFLISNYGWKGGLWIIGGICLNGTVCGALFRPLSERNLRHMARQKIAKQLAKEKSNRHIILQKITKDKNSTSSDNAVTKHDIKPKHDGDDVKCQSNKDRGASHMQPLLSEFDNENTAPSEVSRRFRDDTAVTIKNKNLEKIKHSPLHKSLDTLLVNDSSFRSRTYSDCTDMTRHRQRNSNSASSTESRDIGPSEDVRPMYRKDVLYAGSVASLPKFKGSQVLASYYDSATNISPDGATSLKNRCTPFTSTLLEMFDVTLLKSATFSLFIASNLLSMTGFFTPFVYTTARAIDLGVDPGRAAFLISILGISNTGGRVLAGWLSDRPWARALYINLAALVIGGVCTCAVPYMDSYPMLAVYCVVFGFCIACFVALRTIILVDLLGLDKLTNSFGILLLISGIGTIIGSPLAGFLMDVTGSYSFSFIISGVLIAVSGAMLIPIKWIALWERKREQTRDATSGASRKYENA